MYNYTSILFFMSFVAGFLTAGIVAVLLILPIINRNTRLVTKRIYRNLPISTAEINAKSDAIRSEFAVLLRQAELKTEKISYKYAKDAAAFSGHVDMVNLLQQKSKSDLADIEELREQLVKKINLLRSFEKDYIISVEMCEKLEIEVSKKKEIINTQARELALAQNVLTKRSINS